MHHRYQAKWDIGGSRDIHNSVRHEDVRPLTDALTDFKDTNQYFFSGSMKRLLLIGLEREG